jgi:hypothetical protein
VASEWEKGTLECPERTKRIKMLRLLLDAHRKAVSHGHDYLSLIFYRNRDGWTDVITAPGRARIPAQLGLSVAECVNLIEQLSSEDYIYFTSRGERALGPWARSIWFGQVDYGISHLTDKGLREIGELPDPRA